jgi:hypothetical protein
MAEGRSTTALHTVLELITGVLVAVLVAWLALSGWRFYTVYLLPETRTIPTATPTPVPDPLVAREQARKMREVLDHVGAGIAFRQANQRSQAIEEFTIALSVDPQNADARQNLVEMGALAPGTPAPAATSTPAPIPSVTPRF